MIEFDNLKYSKLKEDPKYIQKTEDIIIPGEELLGAYKSAKDGIVFTTKRVIIINTQGFSGKKTDYTSIPYVKATSFSVESSGSFEMDATLNIFIIGIGTLIFEFRGRSDIRDISRYITEI